MTLCTHRYHGYQYCSMLLFEKCAQDGPAKTLEKLQREAKKRWKAEEGILALGMTWISLDSSDIRQ